MHQLQSSLHRAAHSIHNHPEDHLTSHDLEARGYKDAIGMNGLVGVSREAYYLKKHSSDSESFAIRNCARFGLWWRSKALTVIDRNVDA